MNEKKFPLNKGQLQHIIAKYPTPVYIYDEKAIRENTRAIIKAFSIFPSYLNHFAVKAMPNNAMLKVLCEEGFGADCSSLPELLLADMSGIKGEKIMFTSNETPSAEFKKAKELNAVINLDDITHIEFLEKTCGLPQLISMRYNPGTQKLGNSIIGNPIEAKYGCTREQILAGYKILKNKGVKRFALHTMVASNELNIAYHIETAKLLFEFTAEIKNKLDITLEFINLGGGIGIPYKPEDRAVDYDVLAQGIKKQYDEILIPSGITNLGIHTEWGRVISGPYGYLISRAIHKKETYRKYIGLDSCMADLMRPALYGAYHHITIAGKENAPASEVYDVVGSLCENFDKFAVQRELPKIDVGELDGDLVIIHDAGAHGRAMGFNYNGKLRTAELMLHGDGSVSEIRRRETVEDLFATLLKH